MAGLNRQSDWEEYQENYSGVQNIQAQRQQNLANARLQNMAANEQTNTLQQASGVMLDAMRPAQLNSTTQGILGKYGVQRPQTTRSQSTQRVGGNTTIINNNTTTYNTVSGDYGGPVQGRALAFKQQEAGISKFKLWLDNLFSRQKAETARRDREYEKRERALLKEQNKLGRKLEGIGASIGQALDPRKNGQQGQLKTILTMLGIGTLAKNFDKVLDKVEDFGNVLKYFGLSDGKFSLRGSEFEKDAVEKLGGHNGESIGLALKELLIGEEGLYGKIHDSVELFLKQRAEAIKSIKKPDFSKGKLDLRLIAESASYIGDVMAAALSGAKNLGRSSVSNILSQTGGAEGVDKYGNSYDRNTRNIRGVISGLQDQNGNKIKDTSMGDLNAYKSNMLHKSDLRGGKLVNNLGASYVQSKEIGALMNETDSTQIHTTKVMSGFQRLKESAKGGGTLVDDSFFSSLSGLGLGADGEEVRKNLGVDENHKAKFQYVSTKKNAEEWARDEAKWAKAKGIAGSVGGAAGFVGGFAMGGGLLGATLLAGAGTYAGAGTVEALEEPLREGRIVRMAPYGMDVDPGDQLLRDRKGQPLTTTGYVITPEIIDKIEKALSVNFDVSDSNSMKKMENLLIEIKKKSAARKHQGDELAEYISKFHSDTSAEEFSEDLSTAQGYHDMYERHISEREELKNREDRVYNSALKYNARTHRNISNALGEAASPELTDFIYKSQEFAKNTTTKKSRGKCGAAVRRALAYGGMTGFDPDGMHGYVYEGWLPSHGYAEVGHWNQASSEVNGELEAIAKPGDIVVVGPKGEHTYGHVAMFTTKGWISDFKQETPLGLKNPGEYGAVTLFRPTNKVLDFLDKRTLREKAGDVIDKAKGYFNKDESEGETGGETPGLVKQAEQGGNSPLGNSMSSITSANFTISSGSSGFSLSSGSSPLETSFNSFASSETHEESLSNIEQLMSDVTIKLDAISKYIKITALAGTATADNTASTNDSVAAVAQIEASKKDEKPVAPYKDYTNGNYQMKDITW